MPSVLVRLLEVTSTSAHCRRYGHLETEVNDGLTSDTDTDVRDRKYG